VKYFVIKDEVAEEGVLMHIGYGIAVKDRNVVIKSVPDICSSHKAVKKLCNMCNRLKLDSEQLDDVIQDFLADI